ncbi:MAG: hypothetical protein RO009_23020 [Pseudorhodoplanes sp.]|jgi:hypothetical protein|nr:hypothetical protein [Pseudorhodoplanes sp.]
MRLQLRKVGDIKPWVAQIVGPDRRYIFQRQFLQASWAGDVATFELDENPVFVYEVCESTGVTKENPKGNWRYYAGITFGTGELEKFGIEEAQHRMAGYYAFVRTGELPARYQPAECVRPSAQELEELAQLMPRAAEPAPFAPRPFLEDEEEDEDVDLSGDG